MGKYRFILVLAMSIPMAIFGQSGVPIEKLSAVLDATAFVSGETLHYAIRCTDASGKPSQLSKIAYVSLVSSEKQSVATQKIRLENGNGSGDFFLSPSLQSGRYKLVAYTRWMAEAEASQLCQADFALINPFSALPEALVGTPATEIEPKTGSFALEKTTYGLREKVAMAIPAELLGKGACAVSVYKKDRLSDLAWKSKPSSASYSASSPLPELRGEIISGTVKSSDGNPVENARVALSVPGKSFVLKIARSDKRGKFLCTLDEPLDTKQLVVQAFGSGGTELSVVLDEAIEPDYAALAFEPFQLSAEFGPDIQARSVSVQVENAYFTHKKDSILPGNAVLPFYAPSGTRFKLDDYTRFKTLRETFIEVLENASVTKNGDAYAISVRDFRPNISFEGRPLVIADGIYFEDPTPLFDIPADNIESVDIVQGIYFIGPDAFDGLVSIRTKTGKYSPMLGKNAVKDPEMLRPEPKKLYFQPNYAESSESRIPDYRQKLAWVPDARSTVSFYTSDIPGTYEILLQGKASDGSDVIYKSQFEVR